MFVEHYKGGFLVDKRLENERLEKLTTFMREYCEAHGLQPYVLGVDRHGTLEWSLMHQDGKPTQFIVLDLTPEIETLGMPTTYQAKIEVGVDDGVRYGRHLVSVFRVTSDYFDTEEFWTTLREKLDEALRRAQSLTAADLTERRYPSR